MAVGESEGQLVDHLEAGVLINKRPQICTDPEAVKCEGVLNKHDACLIWRVAAVAD